MTRRHPLPPISRARWYGGWALIVGGCLGCWALVVWAVVA